MNLAQRSLIGLVKGYRLLLSPWLGSSCRFTPTCSAYALDALRQHGAGAGSYLTLARIVRCHPWCEGGSLKRLLPHGISVNSAPIPSRSSCARVNSSALCPSGRFFTPTL